MFIPSCKLSCAVLPVSVTPEEYATTIPSVPEFTVLSVRVATQELLMRIPVLAFVIELLMREVSLAVTAIPVLKSEIFRFFTVTSVVPLTSTPMF
jgi:hypothetical protein